MSAKKQTRNRTPRKPRSDFQRLARRFMSGLLRSLFFIGRSPRHSRAGFVLPTTVLLLLVMTLTVGALSFRTASRTQSTFLAREQQVVDNVAAPAIDRAKAKLEYLFTKDNRMPGSGTPSSEVLLTLMRNVDSLGPGNLGISALSLNPYRLPDEDPIDINDDDKPDNAWAFPFDINGDGNVDEGETIAYSIIMDDAVDNNTPKTPGDRSDDIKLEDVGTAATIAKAKNLVTRNGPINTDESLSECGGDREPEQGWLPISTATVEKNFQITAFVSNGKDAGRINSALEFQQVRRASRGNRWGAWFKYDMEIFPGPEFNWNGAIHSEGNIMLTDDFRGHMISSHKSCLYSKESSQITMSEKENDGVEGIEVTTPEGDFQGQLILGVPAKGYTQAGSADSTRIHIYTDRNSAPKINDADTKLTADNDSIRKKGASTSGAKPDGNPEDLALDPVALFTEDTFHHRKTSTWERDEDWEDNKYFTGDRVLNQEVRAPYLDDFYRADNRYGPRPNYGTNTNWVKATDDGEDNSDISKRALSKYDKSLGEQIISTDPNFSNLTNKISGLDGYWERQSIENGMRVVVGQRLELGDSYGWNFDAGIDGLNSVVTGSSPVDKPIRNIPTTKDNSDPLYPPNALGDDENKQKQRVTLRDNLAAVQGMVVYHYNSDNGSFPLACIANTVHPGTWNTLQNSRTFDEYSYGTDKVKTDFFNGVGTNGWEFSFPDSFDDELEFATELGSTKPLGIAMRNLAHFAGDPKGGSPSFTPENQTDGFVHPLPHLAMWGDFSILRRIFKEYLDNSVAYTSLSAADQSTLHSTACTLGMLAYNIDSVTQEYNALVQNDFKDVATVFLNDTFPSGTTYEELERSWTFYDDDANAGDNDLEITYFGSADLAQKARIIAQYQQIHRDRRLGFKAGCLDFANLQGKITSDSPDRSQAELDQALEEAFCPRDPSDSSALGPKIAKYPSLYYLFPVVDHDYGGTVAGSPSSGINHLQPSEEYITKVAQYNTANSYSYKFEVLAEDASPDGIENGTENGISDIAFTPRTDAITTGALSDWALPAVVSDSTDLNPESMSIMIPGRTKVASLSLLDKVMYNGREEMAVRVLDVDLGKLTRKKNGTDYWISDDKESVSGILYAAREDAVREDSIVRPKSDDWDKCNTLTELVSSDCYMKTSASNPQDPPLSLREEGGENTFVGISLKPVDFAPDPDRRPYGFRLNAHFDNGQGDISDNKKRNWGLSFVTDNAAYIRGEFNPHIVENVTTNADGSITTTTSTIEEFIETLIDGTVQYAGDFYNERGKLPNNGSLNTDEFATDAKDRWRVAEILADSVSVISERFVDGSVEEGFIRDNNETSELFRNVAGTLSKTSFLNQQKPDKRFGNIANWLRASGEYLTHEVNWKPTSGDKGGKSGRIPIWVGRNGESRTQGWNSDSELFFRQWDNAEGNSVGDKDAASVVPGKVIEGNKFVLPNNRSTNALITVPKALEPKVNATIISGIVPSRKNQSFGGLHNFPRFLENWDDGVKVPLFIQGSFLQLNFSTAATGPFDADAWDPGDSVEGSERIQYYSPPGRRWGYDVALQYSPAGPIAQRFVTIERPRSEHYRDLSIDDPYVENLRCAQTKESGTWKKLFPGECN